ncbi:choice-of-anchor D domain-containing protein [Micromonospora sp. NPDC050200]|uniref:choice-of-anchor D domain-containing protein n=1 Tax=Micromonospora sp. NPDC050200 TaxID=3155664 RepID=UPI0033FCF0EE
MRKFRALLGIGIAGACALAVLPGVALAAPTAPYTALTIDVGQAWGSTVTNPGVYDASNATMYAYAFGDAGVRLTARANATGDYFVIDAVPPAGQRFVEGQTYETRRSWDSTHAGLDLSGGGTGCNQAFGSLTVKQVVEDPQTHVISGFAAAYDFHCETNPNGIHGEVRWNSDVDYTAAVTTPVPLNFGSVEVSAGSVSRTVTVRSQGSVPVTFGGASFAGRDAAEFSVSANTCTGQTLAPGATCTVTVVAKPTRPGGRFAGLELADGSTYGRTVVGLVANGVDGVRGTYWPLPPKRLMDTRIGLGAPKAKIAPDRKVDLQVTGRGGVPSSGVGSVVLNVTVTGPTSSSFLTLYPAGVARPTASSINFPKWWLGSNNVTVKVGSGGKVSVYNRAGYVDVVVDVVGFYASDNTLASRGIKGSQYQWFKPSRLWDSRTDGGALPAGYYTDGPVNFGPDFSPHVRALVLNITAVSPKKAGFLTAWSGEGEVPSSSTVNYAAGKIVPNLAIVKTRQVWNSNGYYMPAFAVYTHATSNIVIDIVGVMDDGEVADGLRFTPLTPTRIADSRINQGIPGAFGPGSIRKVTAPSSMVTDATEVLAMNVTAVSPTKNTVITVWPADYGMSKPSASNLNPAAGQIVSNAVMGVIGPQDAFNVHNLSGNTHLVADVVGTLYLYSGTASSATVAQATAANAERLKVVDSGDRVTRRG